MRGRSNGEREKTIILAHQIEAMAREKRLRPIDHYLGPQKSNSLTSGKTMLDMIKRFKAAQERRGG